MLMRPTTVDSTSTTGPADAEQRNTLAYSAGDDPEEAFLSEEDDE